MGNGSFHGVKRPGRGADHPPPSIAKVEGRVELYICSPSGPSWPVLGWPLLYLFFKKNWVCVSVNFSRTRNFFFKLILVNAEKRNDLSCFRPHLTWWLEGIFGTNTWTTVSPEIERSKWQTLSETFHSLWWLYEGMVIVALDISVEVADTSTTLCCSYDLRYFTIWRSIDW